MKEVICSRDVVDFPGYIALLLQDRFNETAVFQGRVQSIIIIILWYT